LCTYLLTCLATNLPTYVFTYIATHSHISFIYLFSYLPTLHLFTYLFVSNTMLMSTNVWYAKYEGIALNELTTILIIFDPLMSINNSPECWYCTFDQLLWPTHKYCIFKQLLLKVKIIEDPIPKCNSHIWKQCHFKYNTL
jgi:hypothetical protein